MKSVVKQFNGEKRWDIDNGKAYAASTHSQKHCRNDTMMWRKQEATRHIGCLQI
jgi:hypothetical protein